MTQNKASKRLRPILIIALPIALIFALALCGFVGVAFYNVFLAEEVAYGETAYSFEQVADGFTRPLYLTHAGDDRLFIVEQRGLIHIVQEDEVLETPFLDIQAIVEDSSNEQGLLGLAFDPDYAESGLFYVYYTGVEGRGDSYLARYRVSEDDPDQADPDSAEILLNFEQPFGNHNGGQLSFGADGYLYLGLGDGGSGGDPQGHGQNLATALGSLLRIDVSGDEAAPPADNPFIDDPDAEPYIWAWGLRNPWRFSFDAETGDLYIGDVGQSGYEEINFQPADSAGGENYGWNYFEGNNSYQGRAPDRDALTFPIHVYDHSSPIQDLMENLILENRCSVTGGYVYRGEALPELDGKYFYGDYCSGHIWTLERDADGEWENLLFLNSDFQLASFGEDAAGELYALDFNTNAIYRLSGN